jgi:patatin-like phospholipase/acyl hydrolase
MKGGQGVVTVLSIDGGGIRGIIPATYLMEIERRTGRPTCELFDIIAGTSTGGILAAALTVPDGRGRPKYTAQEAREAYFAHGGEIFHRSAVRKVATLGGLTRPLYAPCALERMLEAYLGKTRLHETLTEILVTAYDMATSTPWFFKTSFARHHRAPADDPLLTQVTRATSAAPTYFPPLPMEGHCMVDGGVFASNPALCAYAQARNMFPLEKEFYTVSLGTGVEENSRPCSEVYGWGIVNWAVPITDVMLNSSSTTVDYQMRALAGAGQYARFQVSLNHANAAMDDASEQNMRALQAIAERGVQTQSAEIEHVCRTLLKRGLRALPPEPAIFVNAQSAR